MQAKTADIVEAQDRTVFRGGPYRARVILPNSELMIWKNEGLLSAGENPDDLVYPREFHRLGNTAVITSAPNAAQLPFQRRFESLSELVTRAKHDTVLPVRALVFHCSRCGSTVLARLFAAEGSSRVFAEPAVLGKFLWAYAKEIARGEMQRELAAFVHAFGSNPRTSESGLVIKLPSWALLFLHPLRACFPNARFAYVLRDPVAVVASICAYQPGFLWAEDRATLASAFGADADAVRRLQPTEWYAWYIDRNLRLALQHEREFTEVIDHAEIAEGALRCVNAVTSANLTASQPEIQQLLTRHAKSPTDVYKPVRLRAENEFVELVSSIAGEAYGQWRQRLKRAR
jgi:hypothetical protein